ncbi:hypothetical protein AAL_06905 [Moelleriella libera RCEF 2490]|uniref:Uncharacterized protein n=1 Tax=Moelleriella libera RCEF 2490 TaxID=1081109 RepID=A0A167YCM9_9HYPO|nr:hypothetical protein AAL_06905 [Moelleriella libera RCEF 2490]
MRAVVTSPAVPIVVEALVLAPSDPIPRHGYSKDAVAQSALILTHPDHFQGGGGKVPYPKHVWSPAGGWYAQPSNWRANTLVAAATIVGVVAVTWKFSAERESWARKPESGDWHPSRHWSKQLVQWDEEDKVKAQQGK